MFLMSDMYIGKAILSVGYFDRQRILVTSLSGARKFVIWATLSHSASVSAYLDVSPLGLQ